jgi:hypothetical protein
MKKSLLIVIALGGGALLGVSSVLGACGGVVLEGGGADAGAEGGGDSGSAAVDSGSPGTDAGPNLDAGPKSDSGKASSDAGCTATRTPAKHRPTAAACPTTRGPGSTDLGGTPCVFSDAGPPLKCTQDSDCTAGINGRCYVEEYAGIKCEPFCSYDTCFSDSDCAASDAGNVACLCRTTVFGSADTPNLCAIGSECRLDSDCGPCGFCSPSDLAGTFCGTPPTWFCHTPSDQCTDDSDCPNGVTCTHDAMTKRWTCATVCSGPPP